MAQKYVNSESLYKTARPFRKNSFFCSMADKHRALPTLDFTLLSAFEQEDLRQFITGNNAKSILVLAAENQGLSDGLLEFMSKILQAVKIHFPQDIALLKSTHQASFSFIQIAREVPVSKILSFGLPAGQLGLHWRYSLYSPLHKLDRTFLFAERLSLIQADKQRKMLLWKALQQMFPQ